MIVIAKTKRFTLMSYGNGAAFLLKNEGSPLEVAVQGSDAVQFDYELDLWQQSFPDMEMDDILSEMWKGYVSGDFRKDIRP